jgi:hypothetical protein
MQKPGEICMLRFSVLLLVIFGTHLTTSAQDTAKATTVYDQWTQGITRDPKFFPLAVWLQSPRNAKRYKQAGINLYVGLWNGPTEQQLVDLKRAQMPVVCTQNETGMKSSNADIIVAWMHGDEPDNAQPLKSGGYGPPIDPSVIVKDYQKIRERDSTRPVLLNLGQGVAYDNYIGRGVRRNHPEDYPLYIKGSDIVSFDIYPAVHDKQEVAGKLEFVPRGVDRLRQWSNDEKIVWNCIECSRISNTSVKPTPQQIRSEVWMSLIKGSRGIIYFVHQFEPNFIEASLLDDPELLEAVTHLNRQITELAPVLNSPSLLNAVAIESDLEKPPLDVMCKRYGNSLYVFVANVRPEKSVAKLRLLNPSSASTQAREIENGSEVMIRDSIINLEIAGYGIVLYRIDG